MNSTIQRFAAAALLIGQLLSPAQAIATPQTAADPSKARTDPELRCLMPLFRAAVWQERKAEPAFSKLPPLSDRVETYFSEVGNHLMTHYGLPPAEIDALARPEFQAAVETMRTEAPGTIDPMVEDCLQRMAAREALRTPPSPARCVALALHGSTRNMVSGMVGGTGDAAIVGAVAAAMPGMMSWLTISRRARSLLGRQGMTESQIDALFKREEKALEREVNINRKTGKLLVYDKAACAKLLSLPPATPPAAQSGNTTN